MLSEPRVCMSVSSPSTVLPHGLACMKCGVACTCDAWCVCANHKGEKDPPEALAACDDSPCESLTPAGFGRPRQCSLLKIGSHRVPAVCERPPRGVAIPLVRLIYRD